MTLKAMLYSLVVQLMPERDVVLPATLGRYAHAALLGMLKAVDADLAQRVHDAPGEKPFTVSPLQGRFERVPRRDGDGAVIKGLVQLTAGGEYWLRFTFLTEELYQAISRFFLESPSPVVQLDAGRFVVARVTATVGEKASWSGHATFEQLWEEAPGREQVRMRFYSPTCFRVTKAPGRSAFVAEPSLWHCVQSWLNRWNRFAPSEFFFNRERLLDFVEACGQTRRVDIRTRSLEFGAFGLRGFVGKVEWAFSRALGASFEGARMEHLLRQVDALASFSFYCGTGYKTTMGMGQTRQWMGRGDVPSES
ncbi:MAG: CRISPR system precrRNA processing endoribonuclease RAMP protein Cas6 [Abditibacteriales bacterium]|nr:CRISPR system precrRNA processing endoribonuclease RAMP protein Cas6 [Abditibacteriales bacterium]